MDEIYLSSGLVKMNFGELLTEPLFYQQKAPLGFILLVKASLNIFGNNEYSLRLIPLIFGCLSIFLFVPVAKYFLNGLLSVMAIGILCFAPALIYHSVEIKQYSTEMFSTILCLYLYIKYEHNKTAWHLFLWGLSGTIILWFSYSSIFVLGGLGLGLTVNYLLKMKWKIALIRLIPFSMWFLSFSINYILFTHKHAESEWIAYWFRSYQNFMPMPPKSIADFKWFVINLYRMLDYPLGLLWNFFPNNKNQILNILFKMPFLPVLAFLLGIYSVLKEKINIPVLIVPVVLMFIASGLELYPLTERFWVFISPIFIIFIAKGLNFSVIKSKTGMLILFGLLIIGPIMQTLLTIIQPEKFYLHKKSFQREVLLHVNKDFKKGDAVYVYWNNLPGYKLYKDMYQLKYEAVEGQDFRNESKNFTDYYKNLQRDFKKFSNNKRVWLIFNKQFVTDIGDKIDEPFWYYEKQNPTINLIHELSKKYRIIDKYETQDIDAYLLFDK
ncbi:hypothetical protein QWY86_01825 [Pedobacter aquatilis]|uniref:hypothetical protein n=1 Tax=Pedobacter aquatilis TaxID=351343 RepID=UPI0025B308B4|nr:hypothetical protein [Pedobacter aquatilis]MDN3585390.1 hypothetical protein [Pedobacter aquatilis]